MVNITTVCGSCRYHDKDANIEINFRDGNIYYLCPKCKKESKINLIAQAQPLP